MGVSHFSHLRTGILVCSAALVFTGCSSAQDQPDTAASTPTSSSVTASPSASVVTVEPSPTRVTPTVTETEITADSNDSAADPTAEHPTPDTGSSEQAEAPQTQDSSSSTAVGTPTCDYGQIHVAAQVADGGGAAGSRYINLTFTNSGSSPCTVNGYPAVNYVDAAGNQIGSTAAQAAEWTGSARVLDPGGSATATLRETRAGLYDPQTCQSTTAAGYRVSIPGSSSSFVISFPAEACSSTTVTQLSVGQVGASR